MKLLLSFALVIITSTASVAAEKPHLNVLDTEYETLYPEDTSEDLTLTMTSFDLFENPLPEDEEYEAGTRCRDRGNFHWCTNGWGSCRWRNGQCENDNRRSDGRASCRDRRTWKWCSNDFQPRSGSCEWRRGQCRRREARSTRTGARCRDRGNPRWCENGMGGVSCKWRRGQCKNRRGEEEDEVSADYDFESNSADYFEEE